MRTEQICRVPLLLRGALFFLLEGVVVGRHPAVFVPVEADEGQMGIDRICFSKAGGMFVALTLLRQIAFAN